MILQLVVSLQNGLKSRLLITDFTDEMCVSCGGHMTREDKINFLKEGEKELGEKFNFARYSEIYGDFSTVSDNALDELVEGLDWLWK